MTTPAEGVKITFSGGEQPQTPVYFKTDLSGGNSAFLRWCAARRPGLSLLKAASFLMHGDGFSGVRNFLVQNSRVIIQDDSGIPLRTFPKGWKVNCYGRYVPHKDEFKNIISPILPPLSAKTRAAARFCLWLSLAKRGRPPHARDARSFTGAPGRGSNRKKCASENDPPSACRTTMS